MTTRERVTPDDSLHRLVEGNRRFVAGRPEPRADLAAERAALATGQAPFAIVLGCADSRVPPETVFDQSLGALFVVRVAGNVVAPQQVGSIEFAVESLGASLIVVLGHEQCGAVAATLDVIAAPETKLSPGLEAVVDAIRPAAAPIAGLDLSRDARIAKAVTANVAAGCRDLEAGSTLLASHIASGRVRVVGAEYAFESGQVTFI